MNDLEKFKTVIYELLALEEGRLETANSASFNFLCSHPNELGAMVTHISNIGKYQYFKRIEAKLHELLKYY